MSTFSTTPESPPPKSTYTLPFFLGWLSPILAVGEYIRLIGDVILVTLKRPPSWILIRDQLYAIGVLSLPVVAMTGLFTGMVLSAQSFFQLADKGLAGATGIMVAKAMITELGPVLTSFMVTGRVGAAMCAELGTMRVTEQIDALTSMATNPYRYLIAPRFIAGVFMMPLLTIFSIIIGIIGGYLVAVYYFGMARSTYFDAIPIHIDEFDLVVGIFKALFFGISIITISCYKGMKTSGGAAGVGRATTQSVVICYTIILLADFLITLGLNLIRDKVSAWL